MKYRKMDWSGGIQMVDKMRKEQDKGGGLLMGTNADLIN